MKSTDKSGNQAAMIYRYTIRKDGFAYYKAKASGARVVTKPFVLTGDKLEINFATSAYGNIFITVRASDGSESTTVELFGNSTSRRVSFDEKPLSDFVEREVVLCFEMKDARLYSFRISS